MRFALGVEYAGDGFRGWQSQPERSGVQDALEQALGRIADMPVRCVAAGRTDAGVHATAQIVHFDGPAQRPLAAWVRGVNAHLPQSVAVQWATTVDDRFHARYAATARHYSYLLLNAPVRPALAAGKVGWYHRPLDPAVIAAAMEHLVGTHDFSSFRAAECQAKSPIRTLTHASLASGGGRLQFDFSADAFLQHMIRNIVGALVVVGSGRAAPEWIATLIGARDRTRAAPTFMAAGLYLTGADYAAGWGLPATRRALPPLPGP
jgi:tRNA pseudouridine38-40 synthase